MVVPAPLLKFTGHTFMSNRKDFSDREFGKFLQEAYDAAAKSAEGLKDENHPRHSVARWFDAARGSPIERDEDRDDDSHMPAQDSTPSRRSWARASAPVRVAMDAAMQPGRSASDSLAHAVAALRNQHPANIESLTRELKSYHTAATTRRADMTAVAGVGRLLSR